jgi:hypothetical protein
MALVRRIRNWITGANCGIHANMEVEHRRGDGTLVSKRKYKNIVVNGGLNWLRTLVGNSGTAVPLMVNLSSGASAPGATDTDLTATIYTANGLERKAGTYGAGGTGVFTLACTGASIFTNAGAQHSVKSVGLTYADAATSLLAGVAITEALLEVADTLAITWTVTFTSV